MSDEKYDICFIGTIHSDRYRILQEVKEWAEENDLSVFYFMYFPSKVLYLKYKFENIGKMRLHRKDFRFKPMNAEAIKAVLGNCRCVVDIQHPRQTGLTMRTVETLGLKKKLITTNVSIKNYDFYSPNNIQIIDRNNVHIDADFFKSGFDDSVDIARLRYSAKSFVLELLAG